MNASVAQGQVWEMFHNETGTITLRMLQNHTLELVRQFNDTIMTISGNANETRNATNDECFYNPELQRNGTNAYHAGYWISQAGSTTSSNSTSSTNATICVQNDTFVGAHYEYRDALEEIVGREEATIVDIVRTIGYWWEGTNAQIYYLKTINEKRAWYSGMNAWFFSGNDTFLRSDQFAAVLNTNDDLICELEAV